MTEKNSPQKIDIKRVQENLSQRQLNKILYECDLLRMEPKTLMFVAPFLFNEGITSANTTYEINETRNETITEKEQDYENSTYSSFKDEEYFQGDA